MDVCTHVRTHADRHARAHALANTPQQGGRSRRGSSEAAGAEGTEAGARCELLRWDVVSERFVRAALLQPAQPELDEVRDGRRRAGGPSEDKERPLLSHRLDREVERRLRP